jgi:hypothetical protein
LMLLIGRPGQFDPCFTNPFLNTSPAGRSVRHPHPPLLSWERPRRKVGQGRRVMPRHQDYPGQAPHANWACFWASSSPDAKASTRAPGHEYRRGLLTSRASEASRVHGGDPLELIRQRGRIGPRTVGRITVSGDGEEKEPVNPSQRVRNRSGCPTPVNRMRPAYSQRSVRRRSASTDRHALFWALERIPKVTSHEFWGATVPAPAGREGRGERLEKGGQASR